ncbi:hypothetical protein GCM10028805_25830 [Spirosoma harenae]
MTSLPLAYSSSVTETHLDSVRSVINEQKPTSIPNAGLAIDIDAMRTPTNKELHQCIRKNLKLDHVITEFPDKAGNPEWVHVAHRATGSDRQQGMRAEKRGEDVIYMYE